jgi:spectinomycin phosphotransferase
VKGQPGHIDQRELARILRERWGLAPGRLRHLPVGFGDHHWELTGAAGGRWFITVAELAGGWRGTSPAAGYADLRASMETVIALRRAGLEFAVAPVPVRGQALAPLGDGNAVTVFPYIDGAPGDWMTSRSSSVISGPRTSRTRTPR